MFCFYHYTCNVTRCLSVYLFFAAAVSGQLSTATTSLKKLQTISLKLGECFKSESFGNEMKYVMEQRLKTVDSELISKFQAMSNSKCKKCSNFYEQ